MSIQNNLPNRKIPRAKWHDYNGAEYFVTICTKEREHYFGNVEDGSVILTDIGNYLKMQIENVTSHYPYVEVPLFTIMPNHVHMILLIDGGIRDEIIADAARDVPTDEKNKQMQKIARQRGLLSVCIGGLKSSVTKYAHQNDIQFDWQSRYHDHIIRNYMEMNRISEYIIQNPMKWESDCFF